MVDVVICGAGPVGLALAALLVKNGFAATRILLIDRQAIRDLPTTVPDPRAIALSYASARMLQSCAAWPGAGITAIEKIHISSQGQCGHMRMDSKTQDLPAFGYVLAYDDIVHALRASPLLAQVPTWRATTVQQLTEDETGVNLLLENASGLQQVHAACLVHAEGANAFSAPQLSQKVYTYQQSALLAQVCVSNPIAHQAFERFTKEGVLALLPHTSSAGQYALVWCVSTQRAKALQALSEHAFSCAVEKDFGGRLGRVRVVSKPQVLPLLARVTPPGGAGRRVAIGNAAQILHPVAAQGLNLGLRDAAALARFLVTQGIPETFADFQALRAKDRARSFCFTHQLARLPAFPGNFLLGSVLGAIDVFTPVKHWLAERLIFGWS